MPKSRVKFWRDKFERNVARDRQVADDLKELGWKVETVWECETKDTEKLVRRLENLFCKNSGLD